MLKLNENYCRIEYIKYRVFIFEITPNESTVVYAVSLQSNHLKFALEFLNDIERTLRVIRIIKIA
ncbi:MAG: hypothetical protein QW589_09330 [Candidatus Bathyarchaeia archaeon]